MKGCGDTNCIIEKPSVGTNTRCRCSEGALRKEIRRLREALEDIANPLQRLKRNVPEGAKLNGQMAVALMESPDFYKDIAQQALDNEDTAIAKVKKPTGPLPLIEVFKDITTNDWDNMDFSKLFLKQENENSND